MIYDLPTAVEINGTEYAIRSDYRAILDIIAAVSDPELSEEEHAVAALDIFYPDFADMPYTDYEDALRQCMLFVSGGQRDDRPAPKLMDWEQDFPLIVAPVNRVLGKEIRAEEYLHWFTFLSAYQEIGDCTFAQVVSIRQKKQKGKKLDKAEQEYYSRNRALVDFKQAYTAAEETAVSEWI